ncbi:MAG: flavodoxin family protein [Desulfuromonadales bacterium]|nr:flavodoxin family protein [Desulfuromonadales bacterium]
MKVVAVLGSPRQNSNSSALANRILAKAREQGAQTASYELNSLDYKGCQACYACKLGSECCVLTDDLAVVLDAVAQADVLLIASPVYCTDVTAQLKGFIDRLFSFLVPDYISRRKKSRFLQNKKLIFILTQGHRDPEQFADILPRYLSIMKWFGFSPAWSLRGVGVYAEGEVLQRSELLQGADRIAAELFA